MNTPSPRKGPLSDRVATPERSIFGTRSPRPVGVGRHLVVVVILVTAALIAAIALAEYGGPANADAAPSKAESVPSEN